MTSKNFYRDLDKVKKEIMQFLNNYSKSKFLQEYFLKEFEAFIYGNLVQNFFSNLNQENISQLKLSKRKIGEIKKRYNKVISESKYAISLKFNEVNRNYYNKFKIDVKGEYSGFEKIFDELEKIVDIDNVEKYISNTKKVILKCGKTDNSLSDFFVTKALEVFIQKEKKLPEGNNVEKLMRVVSKECLPKFSKEVKKNLDKNSKNMLNLQRKYQNGFENRLYLRWGKVIDLLECLIRVSLESGEAHKFKLAKTKDKLNGYKRAALIQIHARAIHIANEILVLLKSGYADGANARWRSLHELAIISFFLSKEDNDLSKRYLDYADVRAYKEAKNYRLHYKKLGYKSLNLRTLNKMKKRVDILNTKYGDDFGNTNKDFNWIPKSIISNRNFTELENHVKVNHLHPFYNLSCDNIHGGSKGFYRLGLMDKWQNKILLAGASNYGLADPLQNTAISLLHVSVSILTIEPDFESITQMQVMTFYVQEIGPVAVKIQKQIEKDENKHN